MGYGFKGQSHYALSNQVALISPASMWKYSLSNPAGFEQIGFDDSALAIGQTPFTDVVNGTNASASCPLIGKTLFPVFGVLDLRKIVNLPAGLSNVTASVAIDNDFTLWVNGTQVTNQSSELCSFEWNKSKTILDNLWLPGNNLIAVQARDRGVATGFEFLLSQPSNPSLPKQLTLTMSASSTGAQSSTITLSPAANFSSTLGQPVSFTALVTNSLGDSVGQYPSYVQCCRSQPVTVSSYYQLQWDRCFHVQRILCGQ
jgi:hypothetical protein